MTFKTFTLLAPLIVIAVGCGCNRDSSADNSEKQARPVSGNKSFGDRSSEGKPNLNPLGNPPE